MRLLYSSVLFLLLPVYAIARLFSKKAGRFAQTRKEGKQAITEALRWEGPLVWLHGSSAGELDQALGVARELRRRAFSGKILITVFSLSVSRLPVAVADFTAYLPVDFPWSWKMLRRRKAPLVFVTFTWDVYPNLLHRIRKAGGRAYLCSAALPENSWRLRYSRWLRSIYAYFTAIAVVDEPNRRRFLHLLPDEEAVRVIGDTRYDTIFYKLEHASLAEADAQRLASARPMLILASTYSACDEQLMPHLNAWLQRNADLDLWVFPHHVDSHRIDECTNSLRAAGIDFTLYSKLREHSRIVLVDRIGLLARAYEKARYCYVGGGFHHRIHNTAEPAALGTLVFTGPLIETSPIALQLEAEGALLRRNSGAELLSLVDEFEGDKKRQLLLSEKSRRYLASQRGASSAFVDAFLSDIS